jgi:hypothetical protein
MVIIDMIMIMTQTTILSLGITFRKGDSLSLALAFRRGVLIVPPSSRSTRSTSCHPRDYHLVVTRHFGSSDQSGATLLDDECVDPR